MANIRLKTLKFPGLDDKYVIPEVSIEDPNKDGNVKLLFEIPILPITFYIVSTGGIGTNAAGTYYAAPGMTLYEWVHSEYNTNSEIWWSESMGDIYPSLSLSAEGGSIDYFTPIEDEAVYYCW